MLDEFSEKPTDVVGQRPTDVAGQASTDDAARERARFERDVAAAVVLNGYSVSKVAAKFGISPDEVREIFNRRPRRAEGDSPTLSR